MIEHDWILWVVTGFTSKQDAEIHILYNQYIIRNNGLYNFFGGFVRVIRQSFNNVLWLCSTYSNVMYG